MVETQPSIAGWRDPGLEEEVLGTITLDTPWAAVERFATLVRLSGSAEEREAVDYLIDHLHAWGVPYALHEPECFISIPLEATVRVDAADEARYRAKTTAMSVSTDGEEIVAELVYVPPKVREDVADDWSYGLDFAGLDVAGKIVIADGMAAPGRVADVMTAGALAGIFVNPGQAIHESIVTTIWGTPDLDSAGRQPTIPVLGVNNPDGAALIALAKEGGRVAVSTRVDTGWRKIPVLVAEIPGKDVPDEFVLLHGHLDSWHVGVGDNATGDATMLELARVFWQHRDRLARSLRIAWWSGHSHGRYAGSTWYADAFWHDLHERCACHVNVDSVGAIGATVLEDAPTMAETYGFARRVLEETTGAALDYRRISRSSDQSFWGHGVPTVFAALSEQPRDDGSATGAALAQLLGGGGKGGGLGWWWHTTEDTLDKIDPANFTRDAGVYAETLWRLCTDERLPFDPAAAADEMSKAISRYHDNAQGAIDFTGTRELATELGAAIRRSSANGGDAAAANERVTRLCRLLIPVNYTRLGPFEHDLALGTKPVPGLADAGRLPGFDPGGDEVHFLRTKLVRERNRVEHALRAALRLVEDR